MDELMNGMADKIGDYFSNFFSSLDNIITLAQAAPMDKIDGFPSVTLWDASKSISLSIGMGVASTVVALFLFFELASLFNRSDTKGWDGIYWIMMAFLKVAVMMAVCKNMTTIIGMIFQITSAVVKNISSSDLMQNLSISSVDISKDLTDYYQDQSFWGLLGGFITAFLANSTNSLCMVLASIVCKLRFIEIYVFNAIAPIAFCTFVSREYKQIGVGFIKRMLALGLQGAFISIVCALYVVIAQATIGDISVADSGATTAMFEMMGYSLLLIIAIFQTGGWSKSLLQVN